jgi:hypothetical protein
VLSARPVQAGADQFAHSGGRIPEAQKKVDPAEDESSLFVRSRKEKASERENKKAHSNHAGTMRNLTERVSGHVLKVKQRKYRDINISPSEDQSSCGKDRYQCGIYERHAVVKHERDVQIIRDSEREYNRIYPLDIPSPLPGKQDDVENDENLEEAKEKPMPRRFRRFEIKKLLEEACHAGLFRRPIESQDGIELKRIRRE